MHETQFSTVISRLMVTFNVVSGIRTTDWIYTQEEMDCFN